jgi:phosphoglycerate dehydrogenase-like enzyme
MKTNLPFAEHHVNGDKLSYVLFMSLNIYRMDHSEYFSSSFIEKEKAAIEAIGATYCDEFPSGDNILITTSASDITKVPMATKRDCKLIIHPNSGYDNFQQKFIEQASYHVVTGNPIRMRPVSEYIISCLFQSAIAIPFSKTWDPKRKFNRELINKKRIQVIGHGHIAQTIKLLLAPFKLDMMFYDPYQNKKDIFTKFDVLILACSLNSKNIGMVDRKMLTKLEKNGVVINAARGKLVNQEHLIEFLESNPTARAYLDVFEKEPYDPQAFEKLKNIRMTSHIAGCHNNLEDELIAYEVKVIKSFMDGKVESDFKNCILKNRVKNGILI